MCLVAYFGAKEERSRSLVIVSQSKQTVGFSEKLQINTKCINLYCEHNPNPLRRTSVAHYVGEISHLNVEVVKLNWIPLRNQAQLKNAAVFRFVSLFLSQLSTNPKRISGGGNVLTTVSWKIVGRIDSEVSDSACGRYLGTCNPTTRFRCYNLFMNVFFSESAVSVYSGSNPGTMWWRNFSSSLLLSRFCREVL